MKKMHMIKPKQNTGTSSKSLLFSIFITFLVTTFISISCGFTYLQINNKLKTIAITESVQNLQQSTNAISASFHNTWKAFTSASFINDVTNILSKQWEEADSTHGALLSLSNELNNRFYDSDYVQDVGLLIIDEQTDYWCTKEIISDDFERDYKNNLYSFNDMSYEAFREMIVTSADNRIMRKDYHVGYIRSKYTTPYSCHILYLIYPMNTFSRSLEVFAVMQINLNVIQESLTDFQYSGDAFGLYLKDEVIYSTDYSVDFLEFDDMRSTDSRNESFYISDFIDELGLTCYVSLDSEKIYQGVSPFSSLLSILFAALLISGSVFIIFLFYYWLIPISKLAARLPDSSRQESSVNKITRHMSELSTRASDTQNILLKYQKNNVFRDVYLGKIVPSSDQSNPLGDTNPHDPLLLSELLSIQGNNYRCICIGYLTPGRISHADIDTITEQIIKLPVTTAAHTTIDDTFTCLVIHSSNDVYVDSHFFFESMNNLLNTLNNCNHIYAIGISDVFVGTSSIAAAYQEARNSWTSALLWQNSAVVFKTSQIQDSNHYSVDYTQLDAMYQAIITNRKENALRIFDQLVADNCEQTSTKHPRVLYFDQFESDILGVLVRVSNDFDIYSILESYLSTSRPIDLQKRIALLRELLIASCEFIPIHTFDTTLINAIFEYCEKHYNNYQLSLSMLEDQFHLSKSSISKYFKANSGVNFTTYIEKLRIQHAEKLIIETKLSVREIAEKVGYQNISTFYNAFRKQNGCTPTEWKQRGMRHSIIPNHLSSQDHRE